MSDNQTVYEVIRDVGYMVQDMKSGDLLAVSVSNDDGHYFTWRSSAGYRCGKSETSRAIEEAYKVTRGFPDQRDAKIEHLESENIRLVDTKTTLTKQAMEQQHEITELKAALERLSRWLPFNEDGWKEGNHKSIAEWQQKEAKARIEYARKALEEDKG